MRAKLIAEKAMERAALKAASAPGE
jgi:hypothetical protein